MTHRKDFHLTYSEHKKYEELRKVKFLKTKIDEYLYGYKFKNDKLSDLDPLDGFYENKERARQRWNLESMNYNQSINYIIPHIRGLQTMEVYRKIHDNHLYPQYDKVRKTLTCPD